MHVKGRGVRGVTGGRGGRGEGNYHWCRGGSIEFICMAPCPSNFKLHISYTFGCVSPRAQKYSNFTRNKKFFSSYKQDRHRALFLNIYIYIYISRSGPNENPPGIQDVVQLDTCPIPSAFMSG